MGFFVNLTSETKQLRVPERGGADHFDHLVALVAAQINNVGISIIGSVRDYTANLICLRDPGYCRRGSSGGPTAIRGAIQAVTKSKGGGCRSCGGRKIK